MKWKEEAIREDLVGMDLRRRTLRRRREDEAEAVDGVARPAHGDEAGVDLDEGAAAAVRGVERAVVVAEGSAEFGVDQPPVGEAVAEELLLRGLHRRRCRRGK